MSAREGEDAGRALDAGLKADLAGWREQLGAIAAGGGFDVQRNLIPAWIKEGERLPDRIEPDLKPQG